MITLNCAGVNEAVLLIHSYFHIVEMPVGDSRKDYILSTLGGHYSLSSSEIEVLGLHDEKALNSFLDDGNTTSLCVNAVQNGKEKIIKLSNKVN